MTRTISATYNSLVTLADPGDDPVTITPAGLLTAGLYGATLGIPWVITNGGVILDPGVQLAAPGTVTNAGIIAGAATSASNRGILLSAGGSVTNQSGGQISGWSGVYVNGASGHLLNSGTIQGLGTNYGWGIKMLAGGSVTNTASGSISGGRSPNAGPSVNGGINIQGAGTVVNYGIISAPSSFFTFGVILQASGMVTNAASASISGYAYGVSLNTDETVFNAGTISASFWEAVEFAGGGAVSNAASGSIVGGKFGSAIRMYAPGTVTNDGGIYSSLEAGIALYGGGTVTNSASATIHGGIVGGIRTGSVGTLSSSGTVFNDGTISSAPGPGIMLRLGGSVTNTTQGLISSGIMATYRTTVTNAGRINGTEVGISLLAGGTIVNAPSGEISGRATTGVLMNGGTLVNAGSIGSANGVGAYLAGDFAYNGGTLINQSGGTITGNQFAARFKAGHTNRLIVNPNAVFNGAVDGGNTFGATFASTLELAAGAGTLTGVGSRFINFASLAFDTGAHWFVSGDTAGLGGTITGFTRDDTIELSGITVTGSSYAAGVLTLTEASGSAALHLPGAFQTTDFVVKNAATGAQINVGRTLLWAGTGGNGAFASASNWIDTTNTLDPAQSAPGALDTAVFNDPAGGISGAGTVAALLVGRGGSGVLQLNNGTTITTASLDAGVAVGDVGQIGLAGPGTSLTVTGSAVVADDGTGVLSVLAGATFAATDLTIGANGNSSGALVVSGAGSEIDLTGALNIGTALGVGDLTVGPGAAVHATVVNLQGQVVLEGGLLDPTVTLINQGQTAGGFGTIAADAIVDEGAVEAGAAKLTIQGSVLGGGTLTVNGTMQVSSPAGVLRIDAGATMELTGPVLNTAVAVFNDDLAIAGTYTVEHSVVDVDFADGSGVLVLDDIAGFAGTIAAIQHGDSFVITGGTLSNPGVSNGNTLTFADSGAGARPGGSDQLIFAQPVTAAGFRIINGDTVQVSCFAAGTRIETVSGPVIVEHLAVGDLAVTLDGVHGPIVWIGQRIANARSHANPASVWPVRVRCGRVRRRPAGAGFVLVSGPCGVCESRACACETADKWQQRRPGATGSHALFPHRIEPARGDPGRAPAGGKLSRHRRPRGFSAC